MGAIIGIDPGTTGAIALLVDGEFVDVAAMPVAVKKSGRKEVDVREVYALLVDFACRSNDSRCIIERVSAMPGQGVSGMFSLGDSFGTVRMAAAIACERTALVSPVVWKKRMGLNSDKRYSLAQARERFPKARPLLKLAKHEGLAEAILLAQFGHAEHKW